MSNGTWAYDPYKLANQRRCLNGNVAVVQMLRASKLLATTQVELAYNVDFMMDDDNFCVISGDLQGPLTLCCQRCLQPFVYAVHCAFAVSPVRNDDEAKQLPNIYEPVLFKNDGKVDLMELFEDELILALPQVPMHAAEQCSAAIASSIEEQDMTHKPFQILHKLQSKHGRKPEDE